MNYAQRALELFDGYGDAEAIVHGERRLSYAGLVAQIRERITGLEEQGIRPGSAVAVLTGNRPESVVLQFALHLLGCRSVWIAPNAPAVLTEEYLRLAEVDAFIDGAQINLIRPCEPRESEPESLFQTGGTTGRPKLVHHRHDFFQNIHGSAERQLAAGGAKLRQLAVAGFWHSSSQAAAMITVFTGGTLVQHDRFEAAAWLATVERERITVATLPPPMLYQVLDDEAFEKTDKSSLVLLSCAGSAIAPSRLEEALRRFGPIVMPIYGMSEATLITAHPNPERLASCGKPIPPSRVEIRDGEGLPALTGEVGEVWACARLMFSGYWGEPALTAKTLVDGWLNTGDLGYLDADGYLYLVDRAKDMIVTGLTSTNVYSRTVEDALNAHPEVSCAAVIGIPHERLGEAVHAIVQLVPNAKVTAQELRQWAIAQLNELWAPQTVEIVDRLPLTELGKIDKKLLRTWHISDTG